MKTTPIIAAFLLCFVGISQACCPPFWSQFSGKCYRYVGLPSTWFQAREYCYHLSPDESHLVSLNTAIEANYVHTIFQDSGAERHGSYWIGLRDLSADYRIFRWDDGSSSSYSYWHSSEPNNYKGGENCVEAYRTPTRRWNDQPCMDKRPFFCEMSSN